MRTVFGGEEVNFLGYAILALAVLSAVEGRSTLAFSALNHMAELMELARFGLVVVFAQVLEQRLEAAGWPREVGSMA